MIPRRSDPNVLVGTETGDDTESFLREAQIGRTLRPESLLPIHDLIEARTRFQARDAGSICPIEMTNTRSWDSSSTTSSDASRA